MEQSPHGECARLAFVDEMDEARAFAEHLLELGEIVGVECGAELAVQRFTGEERGAAIGNRERCAGRVDLFEHRGSVKRALDGRPAQFGLAPSDPGRHDRPMWWLVFALVNTTPKDCTGAGHWKGTAYQADIDEHWTIDARVDLTGVAGTKVGVVAYPSLGCSGEWIREKGMIVREHITNDPKHTCLDGVAIELSCKGAQLAYRCLYRDGGVCGVALLSRAP